MKKIEEKGLKKILKAHLRLPNNTFLFASLMGNSIIIYHHHLLFYQSSSLADSSEEDLESDFFDCSSSLVVVFSVLVVFSSIFGFGFGFGILFTFVTYKYKPFLIWANNWELFIYQSISLLLITLSWRVNTLAYTSSDVNTGLFQRVVLCKFDCYSFMCKNKIEEEFR